MPYVPLSPSVPPPATVIDMVEGPDGAYVMRAIVSAQSQVEAYVGGSSAIEAATAGGVAEIGADVGVGAVSVGAAPIIAAGAVGFTVYSGLRSIPGWDSSFKALGGKLDDAWNAVFGGGGGGHATLTDVHVRINANNVLRNQVNAGRLAQQQAVNYHVASQLAHHGRAIANVNKGAARAATGAVHYSVAYTNAAVYNAERALSQDIARAQVYANARALQAQAAAQAWSVSHVYAPLAHANAVTNARITALQHALPAQINTAVKAAVATQLAPMTKALAQLQSQVNKLQTEQDECNEPMCETVGPKSDWGKLFKRYAPAAIFALLAELAATNPDEVARIAEKLGEGLGPVLESWAEKWIGILPGSTSGETAATEHAVGKWNPLSPL